MSRVKWIEMLGFSGRVMRETKERISRGKIELDGGGQIDIRGDDGVPVDTSVALQG